MPFQFGFFVNKYVNKIDYLEFGLVYAKRGAAYIWQVLYGNGSHTEMHSVNLCCVDIPIKYYKDDINIFNRDFLSFVGITPSVLYKVEITEGYYDIPDNYYHKAYL